VDAGAEKRKEKKLNSWRGRARAHFRIKQFTAHGSIVTNSYCTSFAAGVTLSCMLFSFAKQEIQQPSPTLMSSSRGGGGEDQ
jgi:hypothetical protein